MTQTILVVDDQADERDALADLLRRYRYTVELAASGHEALERLRPGPLPAAVVLDLNMPVMDGWDFLAHVAEDDLLRSLPIVIISGAPVVRDAPLVPSNVTFVAKPVHPRALIQAIAHALRGGGRAGDGGRGDGAVVGIEDLDTERYVIVSRVPTLEAPK
jgi:CheY-like chemotaxis protein